MPMSFRIKSPPFKVQELVRRLFHACGFHISRYDRDGCGEDPFIDMTHFVGDAPERIIFDVGANRGQFLDTLRLHYPSASVHCFEPSPDTFRDLAAKTDRLPDTSAWNFGFGSMPGKAMLLENVHSTMSSMLELGAEGWGHVEKKTEIDIRTIDDLCREQAIARIDVLKSDTQGYDL